MRTNLTISVGRVSGTAGGLTHGVRISWSTLGRDSSRRVGAAWRLFLLGLVWMLGAAAMAADPVAPPSAESVDSRTNFATLLSSSALDDAHAIMPGDRLSFRVIEDQEEMKLLLVKDSGQIEVPYYGLVSATNKTCRELAREVKSRLEQELYYQATVIIAVDQLTKSRGKVYLIGAIQTPGNQEIPGDEPLTVSKAVMRAGGFKEFADQRRVKVTRRAPGEGKRALLIEVDVAEVIEKGRPEKDLELTAGDVVFVPTRLVNF